MHGTFVFISKFKKNIILIYLSCRWQTPKKIELKFSIIIYIKWWRIKRGRREGGEMGLRNWGGPTLICGGSQKASNNCMYLCCARVLFSLFFSKFSFFNVSRLMPFLTFPITPPPPNFFYFSLFPFLIIIIIIIALLKY